jgi:tetratricopeptide (TPR) repeat protein
VTSLRATKRATFAAALLALVGITLASIGPRDAAAIATRDLPRTLGANSQGCVECHAGIEEIHPGYKLTCVDCHGGDGAATEKDKAHVLPKQPLAKREVAAGGEHLAKRDFAQAMASFRRALAYKPGYTPAMEGEAKVQDTVSRLHGEAQSQFLDAVRKLPEFRYLEVDWHAQAAISRNPARADAEDLKRRALREIAQDARERGDASRSAKNYGAALMEYRTAQGVFAGMPGIVDSIAEMERELQAQAKMEQSQMEVQAERFDRAAALLEEAQALSLLEQATISELRLDCRKRQGLVSYKVARDLELQGLKQEALAAFERLLADWPEGLDDEKTRIESLRLDIQAAEVAYAAGVEAEQKGELAVALEHFKTARTYYAKLRDVATRIAAIEAKMAPPAGHGFGSGS